MHINEELLEKMPFPRFIQWSRESIQYLHHKNKTDFAYDEAQTFLRILSLKLVREYKLTWDEFKSNDKTRNVYYCEDDLRSYKLKLSDKGKKEIIDRFRKDIHLALLLVDIKDVPNHPPKD
jgi:hypothetical protein